jgi:hypothetical protein
MRKFTSKSVILKVLEKITLQKRKFILFFKLDHFIIEQYFLLYTGMVYLTTAMRQVASKNVILKVFEKNALQKESEFT